jgi:lysophospholipase L1-like esterase
VLADLSRGMLSCSFGMRSRIPHSLASTLAVVLASCGGGGSPTAPSQPTPPPVPTYAVNATVFYDENGNGQLDASEGVRIPGVEVVIGTGVGKSAAGSGIAPVTGIEQGSLTATVRTDSLPAYYEAGAPVPVQVPGTSEVRIPLTLPIGRNLTNLYLGFGDSITSGIGSSDGRGYALRLQNLLGPYLGRAQVQVWGREGTYSSQGVSRTKATLRAYNPAYLLILYGVNDWNDLYCQTHPPESCFTIDALREAIEVTKDWGSLPLIGTITPVNPTLQPAERNAWIDGMNVLIKNLAREEGIPVADLNALFKAAPSLPALYYDHIHPNDQGYDLIAQGWFTAITQARSAAAASRRFGFSFHL